MTTTRLALADFPGHTYSESPVLCMSSSHATPCSLPCSGCNDDCVGEPRLFTARCECGWAWDGTAESHVLRAGYARHLGLVPGKYTFEVVQVA